MTLVSPLGLTWLLCDHLGPVPCPKLHHCLDPAANCLHAATRGGCRGGALLFLAGEVSASALQLLHSLIPYLGRQLPPFRSPAPFKNPLTSPFVQSICIFPNIMPNRKSKVSQ